MSCYCGWEGEDHFGCTCNLKGNEYSLENEDKNQLDQFSYIKENEDEV